MLTIVAIVVFVLLILYKLILIIPMRTACVVERLGKFKAVCQPGLHIIIPIIDQVAYRHEIREQVVQIPSQSCISKDNIQIEVDGLVYLKVTDPKKASYGIDNYKMATINLAQTTMRSEVGKLTLGETFSERERLNETIVKAIDEASSSWGIKVLRYEVRDLTPSKNVIHTLEKQMEAEREKRAEITLASAERDATINLSKAEKFEAINISEGSKEKRVNEAHGKAKEISIIADATAEGMILISNALNKPGGKQAMQMRLVERYIQQFGHVIEEADVSVLPLDAANLQSFFSGVSQMTQQVKEAK